jgi:hypothetical protein
MLDHFALREIASELQVNDRIHFLIIILQLSTMISIQRTPLNLVTREQRLQTLEGQLRNLQPYMTGFDPDLWRVFERDSSLAIPKARSGTSARESPDARLSRLRRRVEGWWWSGRKTLTVRKPGTCRLTLGLNNVSLPALICRVSVRVRSVLVRETLRPLAGLAPKR